MTYIASFHGFTVDGNTPTTSDEVYIDPGATKTIRFKYRNDGTDTWAKTGTNPVRLGTASPQNRASGFADNGSGGLNTGWLSISGYPKSRIEMVESSVSPGNYAHFEAVFKAMPEATNVYAEGFQPLAEGLTWMGGATTVHCDLRPVMTTYFPWSHPPYRTGGLPNAPSNMTTDIPKLGGGIPDGHYSCLDSSVAYRHLELLKECGFNLIMVEWSGHGTISDLGAITLIGQIRNNSEFANMRYCFFVEIKNSTPAFAFDYLHSFTSDGFYAKWDNKPLLPTFGPSAQSDSRFNMPSMGAFSSGNNPTWFWETAWPVYGEHPVRGSLGTVIPRYDDRITGTMPWGRTTTQHYNKDLSGTMFDDQFNAVKTAWNNRTIRGACFNTWNEGHERIGPIEPHEDISVEGPTVNRNSAVNSDTYLFDITQGYIDQLRA